ncbi:CBS domain-containing protein [Mucilaginibacter terrae]|uniref:Acetoin utilization protein AcuB n=1 Tax=Mucilaginibacter terrae TaxID=1955052 RepID=A0ABU3GPU0_9SPHI|nr:CBS domain-containing protein [Mucilaginibacter terrae]MDT3401803.1 acetoin utilization protein AcuB [Mucilaginibacter terrae]
MLAIELAANTIPPVTPTDSLQLAIDRMAEFKVRHLPVVNEQLFIGLLAEADITEPDHTLPVSALPQLHVNTFVFEDQHVYDVVRLFYEQNLTMVPVLGPNKTYDGVINQYAMNAYFGEITAVAQPGSIIVLEISNRGNSMSQMAQIVESDNAQILSSYVRTFPDSTRMEVTLKLNKTDISSINAAFLRYGYDVKATFNHNDDDDDSLNRYESFMNYLNM